MVLLHAGWLLLHQIIHYLVHILALILFLIPLSQDLKSYQLADEFRLTDRQDNFFINEMILIFI